MLIRTTTSVLAAMALAGIAVGQGPAPVYSGSPYGDGNLQARPAPYLPAWSDSRQNAEPRTVYYKKDNNRSGVKLSAAADLAAPLAAGQPANPASQQPRQETTDPTYRALDPEFADPRKKAADGVEPLFRLESEEQMVVRENARRAREPDKGKIVFNRHVMTGEPAVNRPLAAMQMLLEPNFVCHGRLYFEDINCERYGWELGPLSPLFSSLQFLSDCSSLPYKFFSFPRLWYDCSAGLCLPGDPVPYMLYPPGLSLSGALGSAGVNAALWAILP